MRPVVEAKYLEKRKDARKPYLKEEHALLEDISKELTEVKKQWSGRRELSSEDLMDHVIAAKELK